ncbi:MAG: U32 family peptidase [Bacilli bacterium]|nr:U32 family peptidase [Bacilli bacterium]
MSELLAPAGNKEAFFSAINAGANAVYLGLNTFSARAYANNFAIDELKELVEYAHLRGVLVFVTMNTIVFENELKEAFKLVDELADIPIDALIIQDLALLTYVINNHPHVEAHASTQMGIDDLEAINLLEELGVKRCVLAREVPIEKIKEFKKKSKMPLETFIHGALCVSYSGNCLMSGLIGMRSGNRGRCVGSCRKLYNLVNETTNETFPKRYLLSMKDLNTTSNIEDLKIVDSLKIEGRMKEAAYVTSVVRSYRELLDNPKTDISKINYNLSKTFNRTFTKGYILNEKPTNITNILKPNNFGYYIGKVTNKFKNQIEITLISNVKQGDQLRFDLEETKEVSMPVTKLYDKSMRLINSSNTTIYLECSEKIPVGTKVYKTKDVDFLDELDKASREAYYHLPLDMYLTINQDYNLELTINYEDYYVTVKSNERIEIANNNPTSSINIKKQLSKLGTTPYVLNNLTIDLEEKWFIPVSILNNLRRVAVEELNKKRLIVNKKTKKDTHFTKQIFPISKPIITASCKTIEQYNTLKELGIENIYFENVIPRNNATYKNVDGQVLIGGLGGLKHYHGKDIITDYSFNVVNSKTVNLLHNLGAKKITLSHEINKLQIKDLLDSYYEQNGGYPNLELIVYGRQEMLHTKYCPIKKMGECGKCKTNRFALKDDYISFPLLTTDNCEVILLNGKTLNLIDDLDSLDHISSYRLAFTIENTEQIKQIVKALQDKLNGKKIKCFNPETDTRGHFNKEIL